MLPTQAEWFSTQHEVTLPKETVNPARDFDSYVSELLAFTNSNLQCFTASLECRYGKTNKVSSFVFKTQSSTFDRTCGYGILKKLRKLLIGMDFSLNNARFTPCGTYNQKGINIHAVFHRRLVFSDLSQKSSQYIRSNKRPRKHI